jgi:hypothetical protein
MSRDNAIDWLIVATEGVQTEPTGGKKDRHDRWIDVRGSSAGWTATATAGYKGGFCVTFAGSLLGGIENQQCPRPIILFIYALPLLVLHRTQLNLIELRTITQSHTHSISSPTPLLPLRSVLCVDDC